jgi:putative ATP-dependent endonuclease of OLD family
MIEAAKSTVPPHVTDAKAKKAHQRHGERWFKSVRGGYELAEKVFQFGLWPQLQDVLLPFVAAVRAAARIEKEPSVLQ